MAVIAGKPSEVIGNKDSTLILRGSSVKVQWGNKFIDLIKNGKIAAESEKILKVANSEEELKADGIYLVDESVWMVLNGVKVQLTSENPTYISYFAEQELNPEQKNIALKNIGFYYDSLEDVDIKAGLVYILGENKVYLVKDGIVSEFKSEQEINTDTPIQSLQIQDYSLVINGEQYITCNNDTITMHKQSIFEDGIYSPSATNSTGYRIYIKNGKSYLDIDYVNERNKTENINLYKTKYYQEENIVLAVTDDNNDDNDIIILTLLHSNKYKVGDTLTTEIIINIPNDQGDDEPILTTVDFKISSINGNNYTVTITSKYLEIIKENIQIFKDQHIFYKLGELPITRISNHNYDLFEPQKSQLGDITTRVGTISELITEEGPKIEPLQESLKTYLYTKEELEELPKKYGIYSNNSILEYSKLILPEIFISETEKYSELNIKIGEIKSLLEKKDLLKFQKEDYDIKYGIYSDNTLLENPTIVQQEVFISEEEKITTLPDDINTKIGTLPITKAIQNNSTISNFTDKSKGIFSDNAILEEPKLIKSEEYAPTFRQLNKEEDTIENKYPMYHEELQTPIEIQEKYNNVVPSLKWIKQLLDSIIPIGTIIMWNGGTVPPGWAICDGTNGTPDLINRFIKGGQNVGINNNSELSEFGEGNKLTIKQEHLPIHSHPHEPHKHTHNQHRHTVNPSSFTATTDDSGDLSSSLTWDDYIWRISPSVDKTTKTLTIPTVPSAGEGQVNQGYRESVLSDVDIDITTSTQGGTAVGGNHNHSITIDVPSTNTTYTTTTEQEQTSKEKELTKKDYPNKAINIEPHSYSLIFIMKVSNWINYNE